MTSTTLGGGGGPVPMAVLCATVLGEGTLKTTTWDPVVTPATT